MSSMGNATNDTDWHPNYVVAYDMYRTYFWVLVAIGLPGNAACLITINSMKVTSATFYVGLLALADTLALLSKFLYQQLSLRRQIQGAACVFLRVPAFLACYANWVLLLICFERFFTVWFTLRKAAYFTKRKIYFSAAVLFGTLLLVFTPTLAFYDFGCNTRHTFMDFIHIWDTVFQSALYAYIPTVVMAALTGFIIFGLYRSRRARREMLVTASTPLQGTESSEGKGSSRSGGGVERNLSIMLVSAGVVFVLLTLPTCLWFALSVLLDLDPNSKENVVPNQVIFFLADLNHAVNFFIYFVTNGRFRNRFFELLKSCWSTVRQKCSSCVGQTPSRNSGRLSICLSRDTEQTEMTSADGIDKTKTP